MHIGKAIIALFLLVPLAASAQVGLNVDTESVVRTYFADTPVMIEIARCESKFRQYAANGDPLYGGAGGKMVGVFQVYSDIHKSFAHTLGMDIETLDGNMAYAKYLYEREGTRPWLSSASCWGSVTQDADAPQVIYAVPEPQKGESIAIQPTMSFSRNLSIGIEGEEVRTLQRYLNAAGYSIAASGPGSPGNETTTFGTLTRTAVRAFQCATLQLCSGDEYSNGYGSVGPRTREALLTSAQSHSVATPAGVVVTVPNPSGLSEEEQKIAALQEQILELTRVLNALLAAQSSS